MKCDKCGKVFVVCNHQNGLPNGVGYEMEDESIYNVCADCLMEVGRKLEEGEQE